MNGKDAKQVISDISGIIAVVTAVISALQGLLKALQVKKTAQAKKLEDKKA